MGKKWLSVLVPVGLAVLLILADGCGAYNPNGTGSGGTGGSNPGQAQGFYSCTLQSNGLSMETLILPTDVLWAVLGVFGTNSFQPSALVTGQGASGNETYSSTTLTQYLPSGVSSNATLNATDVPQSSISGTLTLSGAQTGFGGTALPAASYTYNTPASIATIAGTWSGVLMDGNSGGGSSVTLSISSSGSIMTTSTGCQVTGQVTANTTDNFFTITNLAFGPSPCGPTVASTTASGAVAIVFVLPSTGAQQLLIPATVGTSLGTVFAAQK